MYLCSSLFRFCDKNKSNEKGRIPSEEADLNFRDAKKFYRTPIEKNYVAPEVEVIEVELEGHILTASNGDDNFVDIGGSGEWD